MKTIEDSLAEKINTLRKGNNSMVEVKKNLCEPSESNANLLMTLSAYANFAKLKVLLEIYNSHYYDPKMLALYKELIPFIEEQEEAIKQGLARAHNLY